MKHLFVPYELAKLAKEKGFNKPCIAVYEEHKLIPTQSERLHEFHGWSNDDAPSQNWIAAPLYQQLVDWFRDKHNIDIRIKMLDTLIHGRFFMWTIQVKAEHPEPQLKGKYYDTDIHTESRDTYYEALTAALAKAFELI